MANLIEKYLKIAVEQNASDLHLIVDKPPLLRIDGQLIELENEAPLTSKTAKEIIYPIMTPIEKDRFEEALITYYRMRGYDDEGRPIREKLQELNIEWAWDRITSK